MTPIARLVATVVLAAILSSTAQAQATPGGDWRTDVHAFAESITDAGLTPGLSIAVVAGDRVAYSAGFGVADSDSGRLVDEGTRFYIASSTKALTATAVVQLAAEGALALDAPVTRYLPELEFGEGVDADAVSIHDLLTMTEGVGDTLPVIFRTAYSGEFTTDRLVELLSDYPPAEDGRAFDYSNLPYNILGLVLDAVGNGATEPGGWKPVLRRTVLDPLGMHETTAMRSTLEADRVAMPHVLGPGRGFERTRLAKDDANLHAAGGHFASARSLARFVAAHIGHGRLDGRVIYDRDVIASTHVEHATQERSYRGYERDGWGYGWDRTHYRDHRMLQRFGGFTGYFAHMSFMPEQDIGVVVLGNGNAGPPAADLVARYIYDRLIGRGDLEAFYAEQLQSATAARDERARSIETDRANRANRLAPLPRPLHAYAGTYHNPEMGTMHWQVVAEGLEVTMGVAHARAEIFDAGRDFFRITLTGGGTVAAFEFDDDGPASAVQWNRFKFARQSRTRDAP